MTDTGKVWFLTGATSNFGIALTRALLNAGHRVVATARTPSKFPLTSDEALLILQLDVNESLSINKAFDAAKEQFGRIDVVVNKAGSNVIGEVEDMSEAKAREIFETQLWGPARIQETVSCPRPVSEFTDNTRQATACFKAQGAPGLILNVTSVSAVTAAPLGAFLSASKAGVYI